MLKCEHKNDSVNLTEKHLAQTDSVLKKANIVLSPRHLCQGVKDFFSKYTVRQNSVCFFVNQGGIQ